MKNTKLKKSISLVLTVIMLVSCWVFIPGEHNHASAITKTISLSALAAISNGSGSRADSSKIVICSDGEAGNTTVGNAKFSIVDVPYGVTRATLTVSTGNHGGSLVNGASVKVFLIDPSKCQATSIGHAVNNISTVYGGNYNSASGVSSAYNYYGVSEGQALGTIYQDSPGSHTIDITNAVNTAKANNWTDLCFAIIMPAIYNDGDGNTWSDTHINVSGTYITCEYEGAYGMSQASYADNTSGYIQTHQRTDGTDYLNIYYPTEIYLDKSESLEDAGYKIYLSGHYGSDDGYRTLVFSTTWGGSYDRDNGALKNDTMLQMFDNYTYYTSDEVNVYSGKENYNVDGSNWVVNFMGASTNFSATVNLQGTPNASKVGTTATFDACNSNAVTPLVSYMEKKNWLGNWNDSAGAWMNASEVTGQVKIKVTLYDKAALSEIHQKSTQIFSLNSAHGEFIKAGLDDYLAFHNTTTPELLKRRETDQSEIDLERNRFETAIYGLRFYASNAELVTAIATAKAILDEDRYEDKYTQASRTALETAYNNAVNSIYAENVPVYKIESLSDSSTWDVDDLAYNDQEAINNLTNALNAVIMEVQKYNVSFTFANGSVISNEYEFGTSITAPSNSKKDPDSNYHYTYLWTPAFTTVVDSSVSYNETLTSEAHTLTAWESVLEADCKTEGIERRNCTACSYVEERNVGKDSTVHKDITTISQKDATCTADGYTEGVWCYDCETWISGHEAIPASHTPGAEATCKAPQTCTVCGEELSAQLPHTEVIIPAVDASCTSTGLTQGKKCSVCGDILEAQTETPVLAHTEATREENRNDASCGEGGSYDLVTYCSVCNLVIKTEPQTIPATGEHTPAAAVRENVKDATCKAEGSYDEVVYCSVCSTQISRTPKTIDKLSHTEAIIPAVDATCTSTGLTQGKKCSVCGEVLEEQTVTPIVAHNETTREENRNDATCGADGSYDLVTYCSVCNLVIKTEPQTIPATGAHEWNIGIVTKEPTCKDKGIKEYTCTACNATKTEDLDIDSNAHSYGNWTVETPATCVDEGTEKRVCAHDETHVDTRVIKKLEHSYTGEYSWNNSAEPKTHSQKCVNGCGLYGNETECSFEAKVTDPTCSSNGYTTFTCSVCTNSYQAEFTTREHKYTYSVGNGTEHTVSCEYADCDYTAVENCSGGTATCSVKAVCDKCKTAWGDFDSSKHINTTEHGSKAESCTSVGYTAGVYCDDCKNWISGHEEIPAIGHKNKQYHDKIDATCVSEGSIEYWYCPDCDKNYSDEDCSVVATNLVIGIDKDAHDLEQHAGKVADCEEAGYEAYESCKRNGCDYTTYVEIPATDHAYSTWTYFENGQHKRVCANNEDHVETEACDDSDEDADCNCDKCGNLVAHSYGEATCDAPATCTVCGATTGGVLGHDYTVFVETVPNTCTQDGYDVYKCSRCDATVNTNFTDAGHSIVKVDGKTPTCTEDGYEAYEYCSKCDYTTYKEITSSGHSYKDATCDAPATCTVCGATTGGVLGHDYTVFVETVPNTCTQDGYDVYKCSRCDATVNTNFTDAGHSIVKVDGKTPTCTEDGYEAYEYCSKCDYTTYKEITSSGHSYKDATCDAPATCTVCGATTGGVLGHDYTVFVETVPNTCTQDGYDVYKCSRCDATEKLNPTVAAHTSADEYTVTVKATCSSFGEEKLFCKYCDYVFDVIVTAKDSSAHTAEDGYTVISSANCTAAGVEKLYCKLCGDVMDSREIPVDPDAHLWSNWSTEKAATCCDTGTETRTCAHNAQHVDSREIPVDSTAHKWSDWTVTKQPSCSVDGEETRTCQLDSQHKQIRTIYSDDHDYKYETSTASCEMNGYKITTCANCDYREVEILKATGHKYGKWYVASAATCQRGEIKERVCSVCKETQQEVGANLGVHSYIVVPGKPATCYNEGRTDYTRCTVCGETTVSEVIPITPHEDANGDGLCDLCESTFTQGIYCGCFCHKEGSFMQFIYKIIRFFWKLFGINKSCDCGFVHY